MTLPDLQLSRREARKIIDGYLRERREAEEARALESVAFKQYLKQEPTDKQRLFLGLDCFEALYGGSAGGGKSSCLLLGAIESAARGAQVLVLRRTFADLNLPGAIMDRSHSWLDGTKASWSGQDKRWTFPGGGGLQFGYLDSEKDRYRYQGAEFQQVYFDELTQFSLQQYSYMLSRIRQTSESASVKGGVGLKVRSASNPGGIGHDWVKSRFLDAKENDSGNDCVFVPARLEDNPYLDQVSYREALERLDATTRAQLLDGLWVRDDGGQLYSFSRLRNISAALPDNTDYMRYILGIDLGASSQVATTAFCVVAYSPRVPSTVWVVESFAKADLIPTTVADIIKSLNTSYKGFESIVCDAGALGRGYVEEFRRRHSLPVRFAEKKDKLGYRRIVNGDFERGALLVIEHSNYELVKELENLQWDSKGLDAQPGQPDHLTDCMLYATREAKAYAAREPKVAPKDQKEWAVWEADRMRNEAMKRETKTKNGRY